MCKFVELKVLCDKSSIGALNFYSGGSGFEYNQSLLQARISSSQIKKNRGSVAEWPKVRRRPMFCRFCTLSTRLS